MDQHPAIIEINISTSASEYAARYDWHLTETEAVTVASNLAAALRYMLTLHSSVLRPIETLVKVGDMAFAVNVIIPPSQDADEAQDALEEWIWQHILDRARNRREMLKDPTIDPRRLAYSDLTS